MKITRRTAILASAAALATAAVPGVALAAGSRTATPAATTTARPTLAIGSQGAMVLDLQRRLMDRGYTTYATAYFGTMTRDAVKAFQRDRGLSADGVVGSRTWQALLSDSEHPAPLPVMPTVSRGARGAAVLELQRRLNAEGTVGRLTVDGVFGRGTEAAVRRFQQIIGIPVDGIVGPRTWAMLDHGR